MLSSINTGLQQVPDLTDILSVGKISFQLISIYNAIGVLQQAIDTYTGNTPAGAQGSGGTPETTVIVGNSANMFCNAGTNIAAGFLVTLYNTGGQTSAKYAQANSRATPCYGISMTAASAGQQVQILLLGLFNFGGSVTPGQIYYLSDATPGALVTVRPSTPSDIVQAVGFGVDSNSIFFNPTLTWTQL